MDRKFKLMNGNVYGIVKLCYLFSKCGGIFMGYNQNHAGIHPIPYGYKGDFYDRESYDKYGVRAEKSA